MTKRYPLSANQWGMLFLSGISPASALYNVGLTCHTTSPLDIRRLRGYALKARAETIGRLDVKRSRNSLGQPLL